MGLDAFVRCTCWETRSVRTPPPHADHVRLDEDGRVTLDLPWDGNEDKHSEFDRWLETCCPHPDMDYASEHVSNWGGLRQFQSQLLELGIDQFPTLRDVLPQTNGGRVSAEQSRAALVELDDFGRRSLGSKVVLVDEEAGEAIHEYIPLYRGWFLYAPGGWEAGVDPAGFFVCGPSGVRAWLARIAHREGGPKQVVVKALPSGHVVTRPSRDIVSKLRARLMKFASATRQERFRSARFRQERLGPKAFRLTDERTGRSLIAPFGISRHVPWPDGRLQNDAGRVNEKYPNRMIVERRAREPSEFEYILRPLRILFRASVETRNPVQWC